MKLFALTGGPGCGKSTVSGIFHELFSWEIIDTDRICHELYNEKHPAIIEAFTVRWGNEVFSIDGTFDRKKIAELVFDAPIELEFLNSILHPLIFEKVNIELNRIGKDKFALMDIPLLFESGWEKSCKKTIAVWTPPSVQKRRLAERGWDNEQINKRIASQFSASRKLELADYGLINDASIESLTEQCRRLEALLRTG